MINRFGNKFNKPLSDLPATLTHLMFWEPFRYLNKTSWFLHDDTMLSLSLFDDILYYSKSHFNQSLDKVLPRYTLPNYSILFINLFIQFTDTSVSWKCVQSSTIQSTTISYPPYSWK